MDRKVIHIDIENLYKSFSNEKDKVEVLNNINLSIYRGEFLTLFGPNGCGKSTLVNVIAGIESHDRGNIHFHTDKEKPKISFVFQNYRESLMPWLDVQQNICFPLKIRGISKGEKKERLEHLINKVNVKIDLKAKVYNLSGGQAQLVSILRGLIINPEILLLDEPFSALDYQTNLNLYSELLKIWRTTNITIVLISHEIDQAIYLGDRVAFLSRRPASIAKILYCDLPRPRNLDVFGSTEFAKLKKDALEIFQEISNIKN